MADGHITVHVDPVMVAMAHALATIDAALGLPEDGCNSTARTLAEIRRLRAAEAKTNSYIVDNARLAERAQELSYGLERALLQRDDEGDRLDWLMVKLPGSVTRELLGVMSHTGDAAEFRRLIDDVRGEPARCVRETSPGLACGLRPPCPDCGRACHDVPEGA